MGLATAAIGIGGSLLQGSQARSASRRAERSQEKASLAALNEQRIGADIGQRAIEGGRAGGRQDLIQARTRSRGFLEPFSEFGN